VWSAKTENLTKFPSIYWKVPNKKRIHEAKNIYNPELLYTFGCMFLCII
jgi:hypothetical protein